MFSKRTVFGQNRISPNILRYLLLAIIVFTARQGVLIAEPASLTIPKPAPTDLEAAAVLDKAVGKTVSVFLRSGKSYEFVVLLVVSKDKKTGKPTRVRIEKENGKKATIGLSAVKRITLLEKTLVEAKETKADSSKTKKSSKHRKKSSREIIAERRAKKAAAQKKIDDAEHERWLKRVRANGVRPWKELTEAEHDAAIIKNKKMFHEAKTMFPGLKMHETKHFQFCTNMPDEQIAPYIKALDAMHDMMCKMYGIPKEKRVWHGKCLVFAFLKKEQFMAFEKKFFHVEVEWAYGLCNQNSLGEIAIACYRGDEPNTFAQMLVHETSHGFIFLYKTKRRFPSWVNEGMAEYIGEKMVPGSDVVSRKEKRAFAEMQQRRNLGGNFFSTKKNIDPWQYGVASSMTKFLIKESPEKYVQFIENLKEGMPWKEALYKAYQATPEQLVSAYGKSLGIPDLKP